MIFATQPDPRDRNVGAVQEGDRTQQEKPEDKDVAYRNRGVALHVSRQSNLDVGDAVDLNQRVSRDTSHGSDRRAHRRLVSKTSLVDLVHPRVILDVVEIDIHLENSVHGRAGIFQLLLELIQHVLGVGCDVTGKVRTLARNKEEIAKGNGTRKKRSLLRLIAR